MDEKLKTLAIGLDNECTRTQIISADGSHVCYVEQDPHEDIAEKIVTRYNLHKELVLTLNSLLDSPALTDENDETAVAYIIDDKCREEALDILHEITGSLGPLNEEGIKKWLTKN